MIKWWSNDDQLSTINYETSGDSWSYPKRGGWCQTDQLSNLEIPDFQRKTIETYAQFSALIQKKDAGYLYPTSKHLWLLNLVGDLSGSSRNHPADTSLAHHTVSRRRQGVLAPRTGGDPSQEREEPIIDGAGDVTLPCPIDCLHLFTLFTEVFTY